MKKNKLIVIGYIGVKKCYLNIPEEDAIKRFCESENYVDYTVKELKTEGIKIETIEFTDEFGAYEVYE